MIEAVIQGIGSALVPLVLAMTAIGIVVGILVGAAPGLGGVTGIAVMLPIAIALPPNAGIGLMVAILIGANFGNSIPAVLIGVPGSPGAILTAAEGYPFQARGQGGRALLMCLVSSVIGQLLGSLVFIAAVVPLSNFAVRLLFPEKFAMIMLGLAAAAGLMGRKITKGLVSLFIGLLLAMIGPDPVSSISRFSLGQAQLGVGIAAIPFTVGLLAVREVFLSIWEGRTVPKSEGGLKIAGFFKRDLARSGWAIAVGATIGVMVGAVPGAGGTVATFVVYPIARSLFDRLTPEGEGSIATLSAIDASNNAAVAAELIPTFGMGIPGGAPMVLIMAALSAQGIIPGPQLTQSDPELLHALFGTLLVGSVLLLAIGMPIIKPSVYVSRLPPALINTVTLLLTVVGTFSLRWSMFDVWVCVIAGIVGFGLSRGGYPVAPAALAFILGKSAEANLRRGLMMTDGDWLAFVTRPPTAVMLGLAALFILARPTIHLLRRTRIGRRQEAPSVDEKKELI
jgi:putative tricarboxylic transport membrane protein